MIKFLSVINCILLHRTKKLTLVALCSFVLAPDSFDAYLRDHPYIMSAKELGVWVQKMAIFADVQYCIYANIVGGWV
jgi:hypothetical protein